MGLPQLWDIIHEHEQSILIAQLAEEHHRRYGRPLRIAVDEADWRFNNLTQGQVYAIREASNELAFQGIEKAMFYRICRLLTLNIQLIFVFDGPGRPWKRGKRGGGKIDYEKRRLLQEMLTCFGIPYHEAPGEAEAECARLQILGMVDAVWSQDSDCLMFGCTLWIHDDRIAKEKGNTDRSKENTKKNSKSVLVAGAAQMKEKFGLDREGLVLFAMLVGGDYQTSGLPGCGVATAMQAVKAGLGYSLCLCRNQKDCSIWNAQLAQFLQTAPRAKNIFVPGNFPDYKILQKYYSPKVSSDETLRNSSRLNLTYVRPIQELRLLEVTSSRFNIWGRKYMNWVGPVLLTKFLSDRDSTLPRTLIHDIKLTKRRLKKTEDQSLARPFERKLTFSPFGVTSLQRADFEGDRLGYWNGDRATQFDAGHRVECEIPDYWLQKVLPQEVLDPPPPEPKHRTPKRKRQAEDAQQGNEPSGIKKRKTEAKESDRSNTKAPSCTRSSKPVQPSHRHPNSATPSKPCDQKTPTNRAHLLIELSESEDEDALRLPSKGRPREPTSIRSAVSEIIDLGSPEPSEDEEDAPILGQPSPATPSVANHHTDNVLSDILDEEQCNIQLALQLSMQEHNSTPSSPPAWDDIDGFLLPKKVAGSAHSSSVPTKSPARSCLSMNVTATPAASQETSKALPHRSYNSSRVAGPDVGGTAPRQAPDWSLTPMATVATESTPTPLKAGQTAPGYGVLQASTVSSPADIRAARLRHFVPSPAASAIADIPKASPLPTTTPSKPARSAFRVPVEVDYIDLTDD